MILRESKSLNTIKKYKTYGTRRYILCSDIKILKNSYFFVSDRFLENNLYDGGSMLFVIGNL